MLKIVLLQSFVLSIVASLAAVFLGKTGFVSALLGGGCYLAPNILLLAFLQRKRLPRRGQKSSATTSDLFIGKLIQLPLVVLFMLLCVQQYSDLNWPVFLLALLFVIKAPLLSLLTIFH